MMQRYESKPWDIRRCDMVRADDGQYVRYDEARAEIERLKEDVNNLTASLAGEVNEIERLTKARDNLSRLEQSHREQANEQFHRAEKAEAERDSQEADFAKSIAIEVASRLEAEAERDEARAQVAMAYEVTAGLPQDPNWVWRFEPRWSARELSEAIRALTPADAKAALEAYGCEKVREGMQLVIDRLRHEGQINPSLTYADAIEWAEYVLSSGEASHDPH